MINFRFSAFQLRLMKDIRESIMENRYPEFVKSFMQRYFKEEPVPKWIVDALAKVNIHL